jgi:CelD/BcsL family acetyltransferase involved in cellulose biosynthesis
VTELTLEPLDGLSAARDQWTALAERAGNLFATWEWADAWWRVYGQGRQLVVTGCRDAGGELVAILPLYLSQRGPVRMLRFIGHGPADQLGPVCAPEHRQATADALRRLLAERRDWNVLLAERLAPAEGWTGMLGAALVHREESPTLHVGGRSFDEYLASRSKNFREQMRRRARKLAREHEIEFRLSDPDRLEGDLDTLVRLHDARWSSDEDDDSNAFDDTRRRFHSEFARKALERGWLRLWVLEADGAPVACWYGFRFAQIDWYYQSGRDPEWERQSVGFVLLAHTIQGAFDDGMLEYRFLRGGEGYKDRFASDDPGLETVALPRGVVGRTAVRAASAGPLRGVAKRMAG